MKFGNQSRPSSLIINVIFEIADLDSKLKTQIWSQNCNVPGFYEIRHSEQMEHAKFGTQNKCNMLIINILIGIDEC